MANHLSPGLLMARALAGSWRHRPPRLDLSLEELRTIAPMLTAWGAGGLAWWKLQPTRADTPGILACPLRSAQESELRQVYRRQVLQDAIQEQEIARAVTLLRSANIEPLLIKGWAIARQYAQPGLRPYGDIDLCVRPEQRALAVACLADCGQELPVDLVHDEFESLDERGWDGLYDRSRFLQLGDGQVRVLGPEDHLSFLCLHFLRHGAWRPLWLCDIGAALESRPASFDWDRCLGPDRRKADWIACALGAAHQLLAAEVSDTPVAARARNLPRWLVPAVLAQWERPAAAHYAPSPIRTALEHPPALPAALRRRWRDPIQATVLVRGPFSDAPRPFFQAAHYVLQLTMVLKRLQIRLAL